MFETDDFCMGLMSSSKRKADGAKDDPAFAHWVARQMHKLYDDVLAEEVPEELLRIVDRASGKAAPTPPETDDVSCSKSRSGKAERESR